MEIPRPIMRFAVLCSVASLLGCGYEERGYEYFSHVDRESDMSIASALSIPEDARSIKFRSDADSGLYFVSYETHNSAAYIRDRGMLAVAANQEGLIRDSIGFGVALPSRTNLYYRCSSFLNYDFGRPHGAGEVSLLGVSGRRIYQWNRIHDELLRSGLCKNDT